MLDGSGSKFAIERPFGPAAHRLALAAPGRLMYAAGCSAALRAGAILIFFPEGTRGEPGRLGRFKPGIAYLAERHPEAPVVPVLLTALDLVLPKGKLLPLPLRCEAHVGEARHWAGDRRSFAAELKAAMIALAGESERRRWSPLAPVDAQGDSEWVAKQAGVGG